MAAPAKRQSPPTHPTVWAGLGLAAIGLLVSAYAYTGTRVYDITFAFVAILGGLLALAGILTAAWGRAVLGARAQRSRRGLPATPAAATPPPARPAAAPAAEAQAPPTVAAPAGKKRIIDLAAAARRVVPKREPKPKADPKALFAFRTPAAKAAPPAPERVTVRCPECQTTFSGEGVRPFALTCPQCGFSADVPLQAAQE